jgi:hypothetical protein
MHTVTLSKSPNAISVSFKDAKMVIQLEDGRDLSVPIEWFPRLRDASEKELNNWRFIGDGEGIHWEDLDEDILVENLLR